MYKTQKDLQQRSHCAPPQIPNDPRVSHSSLRKSKKNFTKPMPPLDPSTSDLQNPGKSTPKVQPRASKQSHDLSNNPRPRPSSMCKSAHDFGKLTIPWSSTALDRQSPKKIQDQRSCHAPPRAFGNTGVIASNSHADTRTFITTRATRTICVPSAHDVMDDVILHYPGLTWIDLEIWPGSNRLQKKN